MKERRAWIETRPSGHLQHPTHYLLITEGILIPGTRNEYRKRWRTRRTAEATALREGLVIQPGDCPLPLPTQAQLDAYRSRKEPLTVEDLARRLDVSSARIEKGLRLLLERGLLDEC